MSDWAQCEVARDLVEKQVRFVHMNNPGDPTYRVLRSTLDGMVEIDGLPGEFAPHLFVVTDPTPAEPR